MIDDSSEVFSSGTSQNGVPGTWNSFPVVQFRPRAEPMIVPSRTFDHRQRWTFTYIYETPKLKANDLLSRRAGYVVNGWQISGTTAFQSGTPYNVETGFDSNGDGVNNDRPSLSNPHAPLATYAFTGDWAGFSPKILCDGPTLGIPRQISAFPSLAARFTGSYLPTVRGNVGRNSLIGPWYTSWAFSLTRNITVYESQTLQIRADMFNPFNQTHRDGDGYWPNMQLVSGIVPAGSGASSTFADFSTSLHGGRTIRMLLKYSF